MKENNSHISLKDLYDEIFISKFSIMLIAIISLLASILSFLFIKDEWRGSIKIYTISSIDFEKYSKLSEYEDLFKSNPNYLRSLLIEEIDDREEIEDIIENLGIIKSEDFENDQSYMLALKKQSFVFEILNLENEKNQIDTQNINIDEEFDFEKRDYYSVQFSSKDKEVIDEVFIYVLNKANDNVKKYLKNKLSNFKESYEITSEYKRSDIIKNYDRYIEKKLAFLKEQLEIAKSANISNNTILSKEFETESQVTAVTTIERDQPYYFRGSIAIQKEIELIETRSDKTLFLDMGLPKLVDEKRDLFTKDDTIKRIVDAFENSPLSTNSFKSANYDIGNIEYIKQGITRNIVILICLALGFTLFLILILFRTFLRKING